jgi:hypothetical protein
MGPNFSGNWWKYGLAIGGGVALGAIGVMLLSKGKIDLKKCAATVLSQGFDLKEKAAEVMETVKENIDDLTAEARAMADKKEEDKA